jgi:Saccharopine dehydrogenase NADP binding domain
MTGSPNSCAVDPGATANRNRRIAVFGAYGHTARFVIAELQKRGWTPVISGRDPAKLHAVAALHAGCESHLASIEDTGSLDRAIEGVAAVINCAGPFAETAPAVIDAAVRARIHYLDITGEAIVAAGTFEKYADDARYADAVRAAGVIVAPSVGFYGALGDLLATAAMADWTSVDEITVAVALDSWKATRGTRLAGARRAGRRMVFAHRQLETRTAIDPIPSGTWDFPAPFGRQEVLGEFSTVDVITMSRHLDTPTISTFINLAPINDLRDPNGAEPEAVDNNGRSAQIFLVDVVVRRGNESRRATARGRDIYAITAPIAVEAVERILDGRSNIKGTAPPGALFDARHFLESLSPSHLTFEIR